MKLNNKSINYNVQTVDELLSLAGLEGDTVVVTDVNRGGTFVYRAANVGTNNGGTIFNGWTRQYDGAVNVKWFGAVGDGVTNDTTAIQTAIDFCLSTTTPLVKGSSKIPDLKISGLHYITSTLLINRPINQTGIWKIFGESNTDGGFVIDSDIFIFQGNNSGTAGTNQINFDSLRFNGNTDTSSRIAFNIGTFARCSITNCSFIRIRPAYASNYMQSIRFTNNTVREINGTAFEITGGIYDGAVSHNTFELVSGGIVTSGGAIDGFEYNGNLIQNCSGGSFSCTGTIQGAVISNNYAEANGGRFLDIATVSGCSITGNFIQTRTLSPNNAVSTFYEIQIDEAINCSITNNYCTWQLVEITGTLKYGNINNNKATKELSTIVKNKTMCIPITESTSRGRVYSFSSGYNGTVSEISINLGGSGNASDTVIVEILVAGYNGRIVDYLFSRHNSQAYQMNARSSSSVVPTLVSGTGEQTIIKVTDVITHPFVSIRVNAGGYSHDNSLDVNPTITFS